MQLESRRPSDLTSLDPQPGSLIESQQLEQYELSSGRETLQDRYGDAQLFITPKLPQDVDVKDIKDFRNGKVVVDVALFRTNAMRTVNYQIKDYVQLRNAQEMAEKKDI